MRGDFAAGRPEHAPFVRARARQILRSLVAAGTEGIAVGDDDLSLGVEALLRMRDECRAPLLLANLVDETGRALFARSRVVERGGRRIGVFALLDPSMARHAPPAGMRLVDPLPLAAEICAELEGCDMRVLLAHCRPETTRRLLAALPGVDLILDAHQGGRRLDRVGRTWLLCPDGEGSHVIDVEARPAPPGEGGLALCPVVRAMDRHVPVDPAVEAAYREVRALLPPPPAPPSPVADGSAGAEHRAFWGKDFCTTCHASQVRTWQKGPHARAFRSLEEQGREKDPDCLPCHVTGWEARANFSLGRSGSGLRAVQCEACHMVGNRHLSRPRDMRPVSDATCLRCHVPDRSPNFDVERARAALARMGMGRRDGTKGEDQASSGIASASR